MHFSAKRGIAIVSRQSVRPSGHPSVRPSVTLRYRDHIGWNSSKIISRLNSLRPLLPADPTMGDLVQREQSEHPQNWGGTGVGSGAQNLQYLRNGERYDQGYNDRLIGSHIRAFNWHQNHHLE